MTILLQLLATPGDFEQLLKQLKMTITLYYMAESPPCNIVLITLDLLKIDYEKKSVDLSRGEHLTGDLVKVN